MDSIFISKHHLKSFNILKIDTQTFFLLFFILFLFGCVTKPKSIGLIDDSKTLQDLLSNSNGKVNLSRKTYHITTTLYIEKPIAINGNGATIKLNSLDNNVLLIRSNDVSIENLNVIGSRRLIKNEKLLYDSIHSKTIVKPFKKHVIWNSGITAQDVKNLKISGCSISECVGSGLYLFGASNVKVNNNDFFENAWVSYSADISGLRYGAVPLTNIEIHHNNCFSNNRIGINIGTSGSTSNIEIYSNKIITHNKGKLTNLENRLRGHGILVLYGNKGADGYKNNIVIKNNYVGLCNYVGIYCGPYGQLKIENNKIIDVGEKADVPISGGILVINSSNAIIQNNEILRFKGKFPQRGAIALGGGWSELKNFGNFKIRGNKIFDSSSGISLDHGITNVEISDNEIKNTAISDIYIACPYPHKTSSFQPVINIQDNNISCGNAKKEYSIYAFFYILKDVDLNIQRNTITGNGTSTCIKIKNTKANISENSIKNFEIGVEQIARGNARNLEIQMKNNKIDTQVKFIKNKNDK